MSEIQFQQTVMLEQEFLAEREAKEIERANEVLAEIREARDEEFRKQIEDMYPILKGWK